MTNVRISESWSADDRETRKAKFKEGKGDVDVDMVMELEPQPMVSWKQILLGKGISDKEEVILCAEVDSVEDIEFLEGDCNTQIPYTVVS